MKILQCWDDGVAADIRLCEILRKYQAKASFNLNAGLHETHRSNGWQYQQHWVERLARHELVSVYEGFTIANHSLTHPDLTQLSGAELARQIIDNQHILQDWFNQPVTGFAYPFGAWNERTTATLQASGHSYARTTLADPWCFPPTNPYTFSPTCHFLSPNFWDLFQQAKATGVFYFWGHSYEITTENMWYEFENTVRKITSDPDNEWTDIADCFAGKA